MTSFKKVKNAFITKTSLRYWANLVLNYNAYVFEEDFFSPVVRTNSTAEAMELLQATFTPANFRAFMGKDGSPRNRIDPDDDLPDFLRSVWNKGQGKLPVKRVLWTMAARLDSKISRSKTREPLEMRFDELQHAFSLSDLERDILTCAYLLDANALSIPQHSFRNTDLTIFYAMAVNCSHEEVMEVLGNNSNLRKFELLDSDWEFNDNDFGAFLRCSDTVPLGRKYYRRVEGGVLPS